MALPANRHDDVLLALPGIGHRHAGCGRVQLGFPHHGAGCLVECAEFLAAGAWRLLRKTLTHKDQTLCHQRANTPRFAKWWKVQLLKRRVVAWSVSVGDGPLQ